MEATDAADVGGRLLQAARRRFGQTARVENLARPTVGGSNQTIVFDLMERAADRRLVQPLPRSPATCPRRLWLVKPVNAWMKRQREPARAMARCSPKRKAAETAAAVVR